MRKGRRARRSSVSAECSGELSRQGSVFKGPRFKVFPKTEEQTSLIAKNIKENFLFSRMPEDVLNEVITFMFHKNVKGGEEIISQGQEGDFFYFLEKGSCEVFVNTEKVLDYEPGSCFGELALMYNCPRAATVNSTSECEVWMLERQVFRYYISEAEKKRKSYYEQSLRFCGLFRNLTQLEFAKISEVMTERRFSKNEVIMTQGEDDYENMKFYIVFSGLVVAYKQVFVSVRSSEQKYRRPTPPMSRRPSSAGNSKKEKPHRKARRTSSSVLETKNVLIGKMGPGDYFGEMALLKREPRAATVKVATDEVVCGMFDVASFERLLGSCSEILRRGMETYTQGESVSEIERNENDGDTSLPRIKGTRRVSFQSSKAESEIIEIPKEIVTEKQVEENSNVVMPKKDNNQRHPNDPEKNQIKDTFKLRERSESSRTVTSEDQPAIET
eukprot:snap_masked-scaffold_56-processed-gene-1.44-mRNA-1 protein AED:0.67 eAED:0.67 QI:0/-1/0/1/-1/1/1/0/442